MHEGKSASGAPFRTTWGAGTVRTPSACAAPRASGRAIAREAAFLSMSIAREAAFLWHFYAFHVAIWRPADPNCPVTLCGVEWPYAELVPSSADESPVNGPVRSPAAQPGRVGRSMDDIDLDKVKL